MAELIGEGWERFTPEKPPQDLEGKTESPSPGLDNKPTKFSDIGARERSIMDFLLARYLKNTEEAKKEGWTPQVPKVKRYEDLGKNKEGVLSPKVRSLKKGKHKDTLGSKVQ